MHAVWTLGIVGGLGASIGVHALTQAAHSYVLLLQVICSIENWQKQDSLHVLVGESALHYCKSQYFCCIDHVPYN